MRGGRERVERGERKSLINRQEKCQDTTERDSAWLATLVRTGQQRTENRREEGKTGEKRRKQERRGENSTEQENLHCTPVVSDPDTNRFKRTHK